MASSLSYSRVGLLLVPATSPTTSSSCRPAFPSPRRRAARLAHDVDPTRSPGRQCRCTLGRSRQKHVPRAADKEPSSSVQEKEAEEDLPPWVRSERQRELQKGEGPNIPFPVYLLASAIVTIAAVGSIYEFFNKNSIFGVVSPSSPFYTPILAVFAITGLPTAGYLFIRAVNAANKEAEKQDKIDGY